MDGRHRQRAVVGPMTIITGSSVILSGIPMTAAGFSGTVVTGWDGVCQSWIPSRSSDGVRFGGMPVVLEQDVSHTT